LNGTCLLKFVALGRVVRVDDDRVAVSVDHYQFRNKGIFPKCHSLTIVRE
jgi:hypothetical protein